MPDSHNAMFVKPGRAAHWAGANRVGRRRKHNRYDRCRLFCYDDRRRPHPDDDGDLEPDELSRDLGETLGASFSPSILNIICLRFISSDNLPMPG